MKLSKNSWHYKLNMLYDDWVPSNLCPYFWKTVYRTILLPLNLVLAIPMFILEWIYGDRFDGKSDWIWIKAILGFMIFLVLLCGISAIAMLFIQREAVVAVGVTGWIIIFGIGFSWLWGKYQDSRENNPPSLIGSYFKAKKEKVCPKIEWED